MLLSRITRCFVYWIEGFFQLWSDFDWDFCFQKFIKWVKLFSHSGNIVFVIIYEAQITLQSFFGFGESHFVSKDLNFTRLWCYSLGWNGSPKKFNLPDSKVALFNCHFQSCIENALEDCPNVPVRSVALLAAISKSSTCWAHWSTLTTGSKYSRMKLETADIDLLRPCASLLLAKVLLAKLNASISIERWSAICKQW